MKIKSILIFLFFFISINNISKADFFKVCGINKTEVNNINYVLKNGNSKFIPREIDDIKNETFKQALYLLSFYKDNSAFPDEMFNIIDLNVIKNINRFQQYSINYILKKNRYKESEIKKELKTLSLNNMDYLFILKNRYFQPDDISNSYVTFFLKKVFYEKSLLYEDILFLLDKYNEKITESMIIQQIRLRLWNNKRDDISKIKKLIKNENIKKRIKVIEEFVEKINKPKALNIKLKNGKKKVIYKKLTNEQQLNICKSYLHYDEYIDLYCISKDKKNIDYLRDILKQNLNPVFLPNIWLNYRLYYVREMINNHQLNEGVYDVIANAGEVYKSDLYTQQFLAGFVAYLLKDYQNAILHFNICASNSIYSDYNAKANYWLGLSYREYGDHILEQKSFNNSKKKVFTMYGQLASSEIGESPEGNIEAYIRSFKEEPMTLCEDLNFVIGYLSQYHYQNGLSSILKQYINEQVEKHKIFNALMVIKNDFNKQYAKAMSVYALKYNIAMSDISFQKTPFNNDTLVNAVIKQESNFNLTAISNKGAKGYMQIMPETGKTIAKNMGIKFDKKKLLHDEAYNVNMGSYYIDLLLNMYDNNKLLALSAYNAGGINVDKWIKKNGDPRDFQTNQEIVEWIEKIPFAQTREYVVKVLGYEMVYDVFSEMQKNNNY